MYISRTTSDERREPSPGITTDYSYDNLGRITTIDGGTAYTRFDYAYQPKSYNIRYIKYDHLAGDPCTVYSYDTLDRLTVAQYAVDTNEVFD